MTCTSGASLLTPYGWVLLLIFLIFFLFLLVFVPPTSFHVQLSSLRCTDPAHAMTTPGLVAGPLATLLPRNFLLIIISMITNIIKITKIALIIKIINNGKTNHLEAQVPSWGLLGESWTHSPGSRRSEESS